MGDAADFTKGEKVKRCQGIWSLWYIIPNLCALTIKKGRVLQAGRSFGIGAAPRPAPGRADTWTDSDSLESERVRFPRPASKQTGEVGRRNPHEQVGRVRS